MDSTIQKNTHDTSYTQLKENMTALNQAFTAHVRKTDAEMQKMENTMENKTMRTTDTSNVDNRLSQLEHGLRNMFAQGNAHGSSADDARLAQKHTLGVFMKTGRIENKTIGTADADGGLLLNRLVSNEFLHKMNNFPLIANARSINTQGKNLKIIVDDAKPDSYAKWSKDGYNPKDDTITPQLREVDIETNTCCASTTITRDFLDDMNESALQAWIADTLSESFGKKLSDAMIYGEADKSLEGIITYHLNHEEAIRTVKLSKKHFIRSIIEMLSAMDVRFINKTAWYMSVQCFTLLMKTLLDKHTTQFTDMLKMIDRSDHNYSYTLLGKPVYIVPSMPEEWPVMLADLSAGYFLVQYESGSCKRSEMYDLDAVRYGYRMRVGGKIVEPNAFVIGALAAEDEESDQEAEKHAAAKAS